MKTTQFTFFKNTPLIDFQNTIHFKSNAERDAFFLEGGHYSTLFLSNNNFNFVRDRSSVVLDTSYDSMRGVNYCTFLSDFENMRYYAYVVDYEYLNDNAVRVNLLIDGIMTYTQGGVLEQLPNLKIIRQHLKLSNYNANIWELKNNDDILKCYTKSYFHTDRILFDELVVLISASVNLKADFGDVDDPKMVTSSGKQYDKITSPLNLYVCDIDDFNTLMRDLSDYPWISQNIKSMSLIPRIFLENNLTQVSFASHHTLSGVNYLYEVTGIRTNRSSLTAALQDASYTMEETLELFGLDPVQEKHLLRNEYTTTELYNYAGGQLFIDNGQLNGIRGLSYVCEIITGYHNELKVFIDNYRNGTAPSFNGGGYVNDSLVFDQFDDIPMLIDTFNLALSKSANQRALAESKLIMNRVDSFTDPNATLKDRFFNAASLISNISLSNMFGKFTDEYEFYRTQKAEQADLALETPTITQQTNGNSFNIANEMFGIHFKYSRPTLFEMDKIRKYYKLFGYDVRDQGDYLDRVDSMNICNFVQFEGSWTIPGADVALIEMMKAQFANGVRLWHNNGTRNPMQQNVLNNIMVV